MKWERVRIVTAEGEVEAIAPVIISASRATDIPACQSDWFIERWRQGYVRWVNPFNGKALYVSFQNTRAVVFWSKNPAPLLERLDFLQNEIPNFYFQFTLNAYDAEKFELGIPPLDERIATFRQLSDAIGRERVIWRFDPLVKTAAFGVEELLEKVHYVGDRIHGYTEKLVFSFVDVSPYARVHRNLARAGITALEFSADDMREFAAGLRRLNRKWQLQLATCAEDIELEGIEHNRCIDGDLLVRLFPEDKALMRFLGADVTLPGVPAQACSPKLKDRNQRPACGCIVSKDIGRYNTCRLGCVYCYAGGRRI